MDMGADHTRGAAVLGNSGQELVRDIGGRWGGGLLIGRREVGADGDGPGHGFLRVWEPGSPWVS
jgi:hypothetical protein